MTIIYILIVFAVLWFTKKIWGAWVVSLVVSLFKKNKNTENKKPLDNLQENVIFQPSGTVRTFVLALNLEEMGDGTVKLTLAKIKDKEV
jgi:hypothetical protein